MQRPPAHLHAHGRHLLRRACRAGHDAALRRGAPLRRPHGAPGAPLRLPGRRDALRHGAASLPHSHGQGHLLPHVGQVRAVPAQDGRHDPRRLARGVVSELLSPHRAPSGRIARPLRELLPGAHGSRLRARVPPPGARLEGRCGAAVGRAGQGDRREHAGRALQRRRCGGDRCRNRC